MPTIIDRSIPVSDFINKISELEYRAYPAGRNGRWDAFVVVKEGGKVVVSVRGTEFHLDAKYRQFLKPLTKALEDYEKATTVETSIYIEVM